MMTMTAALVLSILKQWRSFEWTVQGFGFIRTKIENVGRIHVWDSRLRVPLVSDVHTHPWQLMSTIISGELINQRFLVDNSEEDEPPLLGPLMPYTGQTIKTGEGGGLHGESQPVMLQSARTEFFQTGQVYSQEPWEIHRTIAQDGTVTLMERPQGPPLGIAHVYWPRGLQWISAEPKPAQAYQIEATVNLALQRWNA